MTPETYTLAQKFAKAFASRHHTDTEETIAQANLLLLLAYKSFDQNKGELKDHIKANIWYGLLMMWREETTFHRYHQTGIAAERTEPSFNLSEFLSEISEDAKVIVELLIELPETDNTLPATHRRQGKVNRIREVLFWSLQQTGWTAERILEGFQEIKEALSP